MKLINIIILFLSFCFLAYISIKLHFWSMEYKNMFFYLDDYTSLIFVFLLIISITGILKWLYKWELRSLLR
ncbi:MAG: hypothetical protein GX950_01555 [Candidatus Diapherotrites archaeon]|uniref:Uncharacterized protein n=1 Tax=Candidatus Iainarchaeum sp. TaxID=3101447 RepID=A0A7K4BZB5_9ARCH|nr:hypothetical protein [Candidatus Diapherotrites archaeon]